MDLNARWDMRLTDKEVLKVIASLEQDCDQSTLAARLGCSRITVNRAVKRLIAKGHLSIIGGGGRVPYTYQINADKLPDELKAGV